MNTSRDQILSDQAFDDRMAKDQQDQLNKGNRARHAISLSPLSFRAHYILLALYGSCVSTTEVVCTSLPGDFILPPSVCSHPNVTVVYHVDLVSSVPMLVMERVETSLSSLLHDVSSMVTVRERVDLAFGIVCAVEYFHDHLGVAHGLISGETVFVTQQLSAKMLNPPSAFLLTGKLPEHTATLANDIQQLVDLLLFLLNDIGPAFSFACDRLRAIVVGAERMERKDECKSLSELKTVLDGLRLTAEYRCCPRGRQLFCQD